MDKRVAQVLVEYDKRRRQEEQIYEQLSEEEFDERIDDFLLDIGPVGGQLINTLIVGSAAQTIVEVGASYGYSTVWMADAARATGGTVTSIEMHAGKQEFAKDALARAGLSDHVDFQLGDALEIIPTLARPLDFVLIDLWKPLYVPVFDLIYPMLAGDGLVVADNMLYPQTEHAERYRAHIRAKPNIDSVLVPVGDGIEISRIASTSI